MTQKNKQKIKILKEQNLLLETSLRLKCYECFGFFRDGYQKCVSLNCPLYDFFPTKGQIKRKIFIEKAKTLEKSLGN